MGIFVEVKRPGIPKLSTISHHGGKRNREALEVPFVQIMEVNIFPKNSNITVVTPPNYTLIVL